MKVQSDVPHWMAQLDDEAREQLEKKDRAKERTPLQHGEDCKGACKEL